MITCFCSAQKEDNLLTFSLYIYEAWDLPVFAVAVFTLPFYYLVMQFAVGKLIEWKNCSVRLVLTEPVNLSY